MVRANLPDLPQIIADISQVDNFCDSKLPGVTCQGKISSARIPAWGTEPTRGLKFRESSFPPITIERRVAITF